MKKYKLSDIAPEYGASAQRPSPAKDKGTKLNLEKTDTDVRRSDLIYLTPDSKSGMKRDEFFGMDKFLAGFDHEGNPVNNRKRRKLKQAVMMP